MSNNYFDFKSKDVESVVEKIFSHFKKPKVIEKFIDDEDSKVIIIRKWSHPKVCNKMCDKFITNLDWERQNVIMMGRSIPEPREVFYCGEPGVIHKYSGKSNEVRDWKDYPQIKLIRDEILKLSGLNFNACLLNKYNNGSEYIGYHSDKEIKKENLAAVATLSLGASRDFYFKTKNQEESRTLKTTLNSGDLVLMFGNTQHYYTHSIPKRANSKVRISVTFRLL